MRLIIRSSPIHRKGCYTTSPIRKSARVIEYTGDRITVEEGNQRHPERGYTRLYGLSDRKHVIDGKGKAAFINHSCNPNCKITEIRRQVWIIALRDIAAGEELTYDYNLYDGDLEEDVPCRCGADNCRGTMYSEKGLARLRKAGLERTSVDRERRQSTRRTGARRHG